MRQIGELMALFDWLALPRTVAQNLMHGEIAPWTFFVPLDSRWTGAAIQGLLAHYGVQMFGVNFAHGELFFNVRRRQAAWAQYVLKRAGVPLLHRELTAQPERPPPAGAGARGKGVMGRIAEMLDL